MQGQIDNQEKRVPVFICYRQSDGLSVAATLYELLADAPILLADNQGAARLDVYFDQAAPGVDDWTLVHEPFLKRSRAFIIVCSPGAKLREGDDDWVYREIDWWLANKSTAPILIDPLAQGLRYVPDAVQEKWPNAQRIRLVLDEWRQLSRVDLEKARSLIRQRLIGGVIPSFAAVYQAELELERKRSSELDIALSLQRATSRRFRFAFVAALVLLILAAGSFYFARQAALDERAQRLAAARNFDASISIVRRVTDSFLVETLHASGHPGKAVSTMLSQVADDLDAIDEEMEQPDVQILRFRILVGLTTQNRFISTDDPTIGLRCLEIVRLLLKKAPSRLHEVAALSCFHNVLTTTSLARNPLLSDRYGAYCALDHQALLADLMSVAKQLTKTTAEREAQQEMLKELTDLLGKDQPLAAFSACEGVSREDEVRVSEALHDLRS